MKLIHIVLTATALVSLPAYASKELASKNACMACHAVDRKMMGPSFQEVARKYRGQKDAEAMLAVSIKKGGTSKWGPMPKPATPALSEADARTLAAWVLAGPK